MAAARHYRLSIGSTSSLVDKYEGDWTLGQHVRKPLHSSFTPGSSPRAGSEQCLSGCISPNEQSFAALPEDEALIDNADMKGMDRSFACESAVEHALACEGYLPEDQCAAVTQLQPAGEKELVYTCSSASLETPRAKPVTSRSEGVLLGPVSPSSSMGGRKPPLPFGAHTPTTEVHAFTPTPLRTVGRSFWVKQSDQSLTPLAAGKSYTPAMSAATPPAPTPVRVEATVCRAASPMPQRLQRCDSVIRARSPSASAAMIAVPKGKTLRYIGTSISPTATVARSRKTVTGETGWQHTSRPHSGAAGAGTPRFPSGGSFTAMPLQGVTSLGGGSSRSISTFRSASPGAPPPHAVATTGSIGSMSMRSTSTGCLVWSPPDWPEATSPRPCKSSAVGVSASPRFGGGKSLPAAHTVSWCPPSNGRKPTVCVATPLRGGPDAGGDEVKFD